MFDLGNTLAAYYRAEEFQPVMERSIAAVLQELQAVQLCELDLESALAAAASENREAADFRFAPLLPRLERIFGLGAVTDAALADRMCSLFLQPIFAVGRVYDDVLPVLSRLRSAGYPLAIVSNSPWGSPAALWRKELGRLGLAAAVDAIVMCGDVGWRKPARVIFEHAATCLQRQCNDCIFVGDDLKWDIEGSKNAGMRAVLFDPEGRHTHYTGERVATLAELPTLLPQTCHA